MALRAPFPSSVLKDRPREYIPPPQQRYRVPRAGIGEKIARRLILPGSVEKKERRGGETKSSTYRRSNQPERGRESLPVR
jgi:hypothetical protein